ncbi:hypothetical protein [Fibrella forsythiae]|uniref:Uncharacterized protein n=1 Tax=Fibrella forsythiae TaxID=2817061 RepID=A0ABS3JEH1_9BACT|nr:hypothetical protein [Fibrella forsythiae]MBO0948400.1 hypothetical protein [Fibrella forsythiae]
MNNEQWESKGLAKATWRAQANQLTSQPINYSTHSPHLHPGTSHFRHVPGRLV